MLSSVTMLTARPLDHTHSPQLPNAKRLCLEAILGLFVWTEIPLTITISHLENSALLSEEGTGYVRKWEMGP